MKKLTQYFKTPLLLITLIDGFADASFGLILIVYISRIAEPWWLTVMAVGGFFTGILFGPFTGWVADRFSGRACWSGSLAVSALCVAVIAFFPHPVTIVAMSVLNGAAGNLTNAAEFKLLPKAPGMTPSSASAAIVGIGSFCSIVAPPVGAFFATWNMTATIVGSSALLLTAAVIAWFNVPARRGHELSDAIKRDSFKDIFLGFSAISSARALVIFLPVMAVVVASTTMEGIAGVFYLQSITNTAFEYSLVLAMWAVGALIASVFYGRGWYKPQLVNAILWGGFFIGAAILLEGLAANPWIVGAGFLVGGFFNSIHNMGIRDMVYMQVPEHRQGQCWALIGSLFSSMVLVGDLLGTPGILGDARTIVMIGGATATGAAVVNLLLYALARNRTGRILKGLKK